MLSVLNLSGLRLRMQALTSGVSMGPEVESKASEVDKNVAGRILQAIGSCVKC